MEDFRHKMNDHEFPYEPGAWEEFEQMLQLQLPVKGMATNGLLKSFLPYLLAALVATCFLGNHFPQKDNAIQTEGNTNQWAITNGGVAKINLTTLQGNNQLTQTALPVIQTKQRPERTETFMAERKNKAQKEKAYLPEPQIFKGGTTVKSPEAVEKEPPIPMSLEGSMAYMHNTKLLPNKVFSMRSLLKNNNLPLNAPKLESRKKRRPIRLQAGVGASYRKADDGVQITFGAYYPIREKMGSWAEFFVW